MTLIKSLLLGSAAGLVTIAAAQAADLPTKKGAPAAEYVKICSINVAGTPVVGFTLPGSDTCIKIGGYLTAQMEAGNLKTGYSIADYSVASGQTATDTKGRDAYGYSTRFNLSLDMVSNTAYGPLLAHADIHFQKGVGFDDVDGFSLNHGYVSWAGLTAGKHNSFFSDTGGGYAWANWFSPDRQGGGQPDVFAYTAAFGGGFTATLALEDEFGTNAGITGDYTFNGARVPDIVGSLDVSQGWGSAHLAGVAHKVDVTGFSGLGKSTWGYAVDGGLNIKLPMLAAGDNMILTGAYSHNATWYSGLADGMWGENGAVNGNGQAMALGDTYLNTDGTSWATPNAFSLTAGLQHYMTPDFVVSVEGSYGQIDWSGTNATSMVSNSKSYIAGIVFNYDPVKNLDFEFELLYQNTDTKRPSAVPVALPWHGGADGFASRIEVTRNF